MEGWEGLGGVPVFPLIPTNGIRPIFRLGCLPIHYSLSITLHMRLHNSQQVKLEAKVTLSARLENLVANQNERVSRKLLPPATTLMYDWEVRQHEKERRSLGLS